MSTYRIYVDSRERKSGSNTSFEFQLPYSIAIREKSLALIDVVCVPNTILTVEEDKNDRIWVKEFLAGGSSAVREPQLRPGYYTVESLRAEIEEILNFGEGKQLSGAYRVNYSERQARYTFYNTSLPQGDAFILYTEQDYPQIGVPAKPVKELNGAWRQLGLVEGPHIVANVTSPNAVASGAPNMQQNTQLFIKTSLGIPAMSVGPRGNMSIARRVILDAPTFALCVDRHTTSWDTITIPPSTISTFTMQLCGYDGEPVDLQGVPWSCSTSIFRDQ